MQPLSGLTVLDFSTLLPGPLAGLMLAEAGADVIKIERPGGEDMRRFMPQFDGESAVYQMLNRGKKIVVVDLKNERDKVIPLLQRADVLIEQFRPGVMERLGLDYEAVRKSIRASSIAQSPGTARAVPVCTRPGMTSITSATPGCSTCSRGQSSVRWCRRCSRPISPGAVFRQ